MLTVKNRTFARQCTTAAFFKAPLVSIGTPHGAVTRFELLENGPWIDRSPTGRSFIASNFANFDDLKIMENKITASNEEVLHESGSSVELAKSDAPVGASASARSSSPRWRLAVLGVLVVAIGVLGFVFRQHLTISALAELEDQLRQWQELHPWLVMAVAFLVYVAVTGLSLPGATVLSLTFAWYFGFWRALILVSFASTTGATLAFLLSRFLLRDWVRSRFAAQLEKINDNLEREGAFYLFTLRLIPAVPFFVINAVMGLTPMRVWTFWWVSQLGMLPGTAVYVWAGSSVPSLRELADRGAGGIMTPSLFAAFAALGLFPFVVRGAVAFWKRRQGNMADGASAP